MEKGKERMKIRADSRKIGDKIGIMKIVGFGKKWFERVTDDTACVYGLQPGLGYYPPIEMQYAYVEESK